MDLISGITSWVAGAVGMGGEANGNTKNRMPVKDLHGVYARDVKKGTSNFLQENRKASQVKIITGRGNHSRNGIPVNKMITQQYLKDNGYKYSVRDKGGSVVVETKKANAEGKSFFEKWFGY